MLLFTIMITINNLFRCKDVRLNGFKSVKKNFLQNSKSLKAVEMKSIKCYNIENIKTAL